MSKNRRKTMTQSTTETPVTPETPDVTAETSGEVVNITPETPLVPPTPPVVKEEVVILEPETVEQFLQQKYKMTNPVSAACTRTIELVKDYITKMAPNIPNTPETGGIYQAQLFTAILEALNLQNGEHRIAMDGISWLITQHRSTVFTEKRIMRYFGNVRLNSNDILLFRRLLILVVNCANPRTRRTELTKIDMRSIAKLLSVDAQQKLLDYYR